MVKGDADESTPLVGTSKSGQPHMRDLGAAKAAYGDRNGELSKEIHRKSFKKTYTGVAEDDMQELAEEGHKSEGDYIKSVVFGGLDGILTTFAIVSGANGGNMSLAVILILGFSSKFADALSMGLGDALSSKAEHEHIFLERQREYWEYDSYPQGEVKEMIDLYVAKGISRPDAEKIIGLMSQHRDFFVDVMMVQELGLHVPDEDDKMSPYKEGSITFASFIFFGFFPLATYCIFPFAFPSLTSNELFTIAIVCSMLTLFLLGAVKSMFSPKSWFRCGMEMSAIGAVVGVIAYSVGALTDWVLLDYMGLKDDRLPDV